MFEGFSDDFVEVDKRVRLRVRQGGPIGGKPILLLHGYPQTGACWHKIAPVLAHAGYRIIVPDLRGYGGSDRPPSDPDHYAYSKRQMAADQNSLMQILGHDTYHLVGHDRGARVAHRLARDFSRHVKSIAVLDIVPTDHLYVHTDMDFARGYYHWFFLIQPYPLPETLISNEAEFYLKSKLKAWSRSEFTVFDDAALAEYVDSFDKGAIHASCEDYRAAATIDLEHDQKDQGQKLPMPLLALWGGKGLIGTQYHVLDIWRKYASDVSGFALPCGHFLPEEAPDAAADAILAFIR